MSLLSPLLRSVLGTFDAIAKASCAVSNRESLLDGNHLIINFSYNKLFYLIIHFLDPLCGTSWDKWNWDKLHCGYRACPGTRKGQGVVYFDLSQSQLGQVVLVPLGQAQFVPICLSHWDRLCLSQWLVPVAQERDRHHPSKVSPWPSLGWFLSKTKGVLIEFGNSLSKIGLKLVKNPD